MSIFVSNDVIDRVSKIIKDEIDKYQLISPEIRKFLFNELVRYVPQLDRLEEIQIIKFVNYQAGIYLNGNMPEIGRPIASLNPRFVQSYQGIKLKDSKMKIFTSGSIKENGYRFQLHLYNSLLPSAFTRQFNSYDLRMFPELKEIYEILPRGIYDSELINKLHKNQAGFNQIEKRIPRGEAYWPKLGSSRIDDVLLNRYLRNSNLFDNGKPLQDLEMTLVFHGIFKIADPSTWNQSRVIQEANMVSLCHLPIDFEKINEILDKLAIFLKDKNSTARVVERRVIKSHKGLKKFINETEKKKLEGICLVQSGKDRQGNLVSLGRSIKIKRYETIDAVILGLYVSNFSYSLIKNNIVGALMGLYDYSLGEYLPAFRVNLDPYGRQIKEDFQREHIQDLREEIFENIIYYNQVLDDGKILTLKDAFLMQGVIMTKYLLGKEFDYDLSKILENLPRGYELVKLFEEYFKDPDKYEDKVKKSKKFEDFICHHLKLFKEIAGLEESKKQKFVKYFSQFSEIKKKSAGLKIPQILINPKFPIILETKIVNIKWGSNSFPAGFHTWFGNSFYFNNVTPKRVRRDKDTTTDYATIYELARENMARKKRVKT